MAGSRGLALLGELGVPVAMREPESPHIGAFLSHMPYQPESEDWDLLPMV